MSDSVLSTLTLMGRGGHSCGTQRQTGVGIISVRFKLVDIEGQWAQLLTSPTPIPDLSPRRLFLTYQKK